MYLNKARRRALDALAFFVILALALTWRNVTNADNWFMCLHGRDILEGNWYRDLDAWSLHQWLPFRHQKWAMCLLSYAIGHNFGLWGFRIATWFLFFAAGLLMCVFCRKLSGGSLSSGLIPACLYLTACIPLHTGSFRPHVFSGLAVMAGLYILERDAREALPAWKLYGCMALCSTWCMWFHSTMWYVCLIPPGICFLTGQRRWRYARCIVVCAAAGCLNPDGISAYGYLIKTVVAGFGGCPWISEMWPLWRRMGEGYIRSWLLAFGLLSPLLPLCHGWRPDRRQRALWAVAAVLPFVSYRFAHYAFILLGFCLAGACREGSKRWRAWMAAAVALVFAWCGLYDLDSFQVEDYAYEGFSLAADFVRNDHGGEGAPVLILSEDLASAGMCLGLKPFLDSRAELYTAVGPNGQCPASDFAELMDGRWEGEELTEYGFMAFLERYGIRYLVCTEGQAMEDAAFNRMAVSVGGEPAYRNGGFRVYRY